MTFEQQTFLSILQGVVSRPEIKTGVAAATMTQRVFEQVKLADGYQKLSKADTPAATRTRKPKTTSDDKGDS